MASRWGFVRKSFILFLVLFLSMSGILPNLVGLNRAFAASNPDDYLLINESTTWSETKTIDQPVIIAPNATLTISSGSEITFNQDVIIYGKLSNYGTINYATNMFANMYGSFMTGDTSYPDNGVVLNHGKISGANLIVRADEYPEPPFSYTHTPSMGKVTIQGKTVPGFVVNIGGSEVTASSNGTFSLDVDVVTGSNNFDVKVRNIFGREFSLDPINIQVEDTSGTNQDTVAPSWSQEIELSSSNSTESSVTLNWRQASDDNSVTGYYIYQNGNQIDTVSADVISYEVKGLAPANTYQFKIEAYDASGNVSTSGPSLEVTTKASPTDNSSEGSTATSSPTDNSIATSPSSSSDSESPNWPSDAKLEASNIGDSSLVLNWPSATDNDNVTNYKVYKNGILLATVEGSVLSYTVTGLSPSSTYTFKIKAGDTSGNWTSEGPSLEVATAASVPTAKVTFPDSRVEDAVRSSLGKPAGDITKEDMLRLTSLSLYDISNLAGLQYAKNLDWLSIESSSYSNNKAVNDTILSNLTNLTFLSIYRSGMEDLSFLSGLTKLSTLQVYYNNISDLSPLNRLENLTYLYLVNNQIKSLAGIESLTNLNNVYLYNNQIEDITPLITNMQNGGIGSGDNVDLQNNYLELSETSKSWTDIQTLKENGVNLNYYQQYGKVTIKATDLFNPDKVISGTYVNLYGPNGSYGSVADENGNYTFNGVSPGNYTVEIYPGEGYEYVSRTIKVLSGQRINLNIGLTSIQTDPMVTNGVITGIVKDENGVPIEGAKVYAQNGAEVVFTDYSGSYILPLAQGSYNIVVEANGYESVTEENLGVLSGHKLTKDFTLVSTAENPKVTFADSRVEDAVRSSLGKPAGDITKEDMLGLTSLSLYDMSNLAGLQYAKNLDWLSIESSSYSNNKAVNDTILSNLTNLTFLSIYRSGMEDLSFLSGLTKLSTLQVYYNNISDLSPLNRLENLTYLYLVNNQIKSLAGIESLTNLNNVYLYNNQIEDITPLITNMQNGGIGSGDNVDLQNNYLELSETSKSWTDIQTLKENGVNLNYYQQYGKVTIKATDLFNPDKVISGTYVNLYGPNGSYGSVADENGNYTFNGVSPGNYTVEIYPGEGYEYVSRTIKVLSGQRINLNIGLTSIQTDPMVTNGVITGIVKDENGVPIEGAKVYAQNGAEVVFTDYSGSYILPLAQGSYNIVVEANGYESVTEENLGVLSGHKLTKDFTLVSTAENPKVTFADSRVEDAVRSSLGKPAGDITKEDMLGLTSLSLYDMSNLAGLQYAKNLDWLSIESSSYSNNKAVNDTILSNLTNLTFLSIYRSGMEDLSFLSGLTKLSTLQVYYNNISDLSPLNRLENLTYLYLVNNQIKSLAGIESLTKLNNVYLYNNQIEDITPLITNMQNGGIGSGDNVDLQNNYLELSETSKSWTDIQTLKENGVNLNYYQQYGKVTIKATDLYNPDKVINGIYANLYGPYGSYGSVVNENGNYTFNGVSPGNYTVEIYPGEGYEYVSRTIKVLSGQRVNLNVGLTPYQQDPTVTNGVVTGIIKDENGVPVEGAKVYANNGAEPVYTDFSGYYALPLEEGSYTVMFEAPTYLSIKKENVQVTKGNKTTLDLLLASSSDNAAPEWASDANLSLSNLGETKVTLTWPTASDNVKVENYKVFVNGKLQKIIPGTETSTEMTGLTTGTQYSFKVEAGDGSGNWTANGPETSIRTHAQADLAIDFANEKVYVNENSSLTLKTSHATNLYGFDVEIKYDPNLIKVTNIKLNPNFGVNGTSATLLQSNQDGVIRLVGTKLGDTPGITGEADLVDIDFKTLDKEGTAGFTILKGSSVSDTDDSLYVSNQNVQADLAIAIPVEGINLDQTTMTLDTSNNKEGVLVATVYPDNATNKEITWSSSDPGVVEVDQTGKLTAISAGTATITATTNDKQFKAESTITVLSSVTGIELDKKELILDGATKESAVLTAKVLPENATNKKVIWTSSNPSVATVDQTGKVQAVSLGNAVITATTDENGYTATTDVKVTGIANFKVETSKDIIEKGETVSVSLKATDANRLNQFLLDFNYSQDLFDVVNITFDPEFGIDGDSAELSSTNNQGQISIKGKLKDSLEHRGGTLGLVKLTLKAKTKTQSSNLIVKSNSEYVDNNNITYLLKSNVQKGIAITNADVTGDNTIAVNDLSKVAKAFGKRAGEAGYNENLDMNKDGIIDIIDIAYVANKVLNKPISTFALRSFAISAIQPTAVVNSNVNSTSVKLAVDQDLEQLTKGEVVNIKVNAVNPKGLFGAQFTFKYDPAKIQLVDNQVHFNNNFSSFGGCTVDTVNGIVKCPVINSGSTTFTEDSVAIGYIPVKIIKAGKTQVSLSDIKTVNNQVKETNENKVDTLDLTVYNTSLNVDEISDKTTVITGTADAGETIIVTIGTQTYKGTTDSTGAFRITIPQQKAGTKVTVTAKDEEGNESKAIEITVKDVTPPSVPSVNEVTDKSTSVTGTAEAGSTITVKAGLNQIGTAVAKDDGTFSVPIDLQEAGTKLTVTATDNAGNESEGIEVTVVEKDVTVPEKPDVNEVTDKDTTVTGQAEAGSKIEVKANGLVIGTGTAGQDGKYKVTIPVQKAGTVLEVTATDTAGNQSEGATIKVIDKTAPTVLTVNTVTEKSKEVTGKTEAGATVSILIGTKIYTAKADANGNFKVIIQAQKAGTKLTVTAKDAAGNVSVAKITTVLDKTAPVIPTVSTVTDLAKVVTGKAEAGAIVIGTIGTKKYIAKADAKGNYKVTIPMQKAGTKITVMAKDASGNISATKSLTVIDKTAPLAPKIKTTVKSTTKEVTGTAEAYSTITIKVGSKVIGTAKADFKGNFKVKIKAQKKKTVLSVTATDKAKNVSKSATVKVK